MSPAKRSSVRGFAGVVRLLKRAALGRIVLFGTLGISFVTVGPTTTKGDTMSTTTDTITFVWTLEDSIDYFQQDFVVEGDTHAKRVALARRRHRAWHGDVVLVALLVNTTDEAKHALAESLRGPNSCVPRL